MASNSSSSPNHTGSGKTVTNLAAALVVALQTWTIANQTVSIQPATRALQEKTLELQTQQKEILDGVRAFQNEKGSLLSDIVKNQTQLEKDINELESILKNQPQPSKQ